MSFVRGMRLIGLTCVAALGAAPADAHHSFAMFDNTRTITLHGTVTAFQWTNPHAYLELDADDGAGKTKHYTLELTSPNMMTRIGWSSRTVKPGEVVTTVVSPLKNGQAGGLLQILTLPSGKKMLPGVPNADRYKITP